MGLVEAELRRIDKIAHEGGFLKYRVAIDLIANDDDALTRRLDWGSSRMRRGLRLHRFAFGTVVTFGSQDARRLLPLPLRAHGLTDQRADCGRMGAPAYRHQAHVAPELRLDHWTRDDPGMIDAELRQESEPEAGGGPPHDPVVALRAADRSPSHVTFGPGRALVIFAIDPVEIGFLFQL